MGYVYHSEHGFPYPSDLAGLRNGELPDSVLTRLTYPAKGRLENTVARAFRALQAAHVAATGKALGTTSAADSYRTRASQIAAFNRRYRKVFNPVTCTLSDGRIGPDGKRWYKLRGVAALAGFDKDGNVRSLHGWGLANDMANYSNAWMEQNAARFGFYKSSAKEPWHYFYVLGDKLPPDVLEYEQDRVHPLPIPRPTLRLGDSGPQVNVVQVAVGATPDGKFGPVTQAKVIAFQRAHGVTADGVVGPQTWALIV